MDPLDIARWLVSENIAGWGVLDGGYQAVSDHIEFQQSDETEWHEVYFFTNSMPGCSHQRLVVNVPSWKGVVLHNKVAASNHMFTCGVGPKLVHAGKLEEKWILVSEWLDGGTLKEADLCDSRVMEELGKLYGRLHASPHAWFDDSLVALQQEGFLNAGPDAGNWAACLWILPWLLQQVPEDNRRLLADAGVDWEYISTALTELPTLSVLPRGGRLGCAVTVHGDSHMGNIMRDREGQLRLIDFDMTARGPAGTELGFLTLMIFRCGFAPDAVLPLALQLCFAKAYLEATQQVSESSGSESAEELLLHMHLWSYVGMLKMGLLCAVLMSNKGHAQKREVMRTRGPVLLHPKFLEAAKTTMQKALDGDSTTRQDLLSRGLFFMAEERYKTLLPPE